MRSDDLFCQDHWPTMPNMSPVLKLIWMVFLIARKDEADSVTLICRKREVKMMYTPKGQGEFEMVPPPSRYFPSIVKVLRSVCEEEKDSQGVLRFSHTKNDDEEKIVLFIDYKDGEDSVRSQMEGGIKKLYEAEEAEKWLKADKEKKKHRRQLITWSTVLVLAIVSILTIVLLYQ